MSPPSEPIAIILGTRPEIIKCAPLIHECHHRDLDHLVIHTGQHYSAFLDDVFFEQFDLSTPDHHLGIGSGSHGEQTAQMLVGIEEVLLKEEVGMALVQGDTNTSLAGSLAASKLDIPVGHVEAGLRSFDRTMPEEINRVIADHISDLLFAPTTEAANQLHHEAIPESRIIETGNTIVDALTAYVDAVASTPPVIADTGLKQGEFLLATAHRPSNVDDPDQFIRLLDGLNRVATTLEMPIVYPIHPRAAETLEQANIDLPDPIIAIEPLGYYDFLTLETHARLILTDSGGIQEEACVLGVPCVTLRASTERPETIRVGANRLVGTDPDEILVGALDMVDQPTDWPNPFGDGDAASQILDAIITKQPVEASP